MQPDLQHDAAMSLASFALSLAILYALYLYLTSTKPASGEPNINLVIQNMRARAAPYAQDLLPECAPGQQRACADSRGCRGVDICTSRGAWTGCIESAPECVAGEKRGCGLTTTQCGFGTQACLACGQWSGCS